MIMRNLLWKIINVLFVVLVIGASLSSYQVLKDYVFWSAGLAALLTLINFFAVRQTGDPRANYVLLILPSLYVIGLMGVAAATATLGFKIFFAAAGGLLLYFYQFYFPQPPPRFMEDLFSMVTGFLLLTAGWAVNFFFALPWWVLTTAIFLAFLLVFGQAFLKLQRAALVRRRHFIWALTSSLILVESTWATFFWPVHFLTAAVMGFAVFYLLYVLAALHWEGRLTKQKIYFQTGIILLVLLFSLLSSPWTV